MRRSGRHICWVLTLLAAGLLAGCSAAHYRASADKEVYGILAKKEALVLGKTNAFTIDTLYSVFDPTNLTSHQLIQERLDHAKLKLTLEDALHLAVTNSRAYQLRKETLYLTALTLTKDRYDFGPKFFATSTASRDRSSAVDISASENSKIGVGQALQNGASLTATLANDLLRYYTGDPRRSAVTVMSLGLTQPLLRGAGVDIVAETLKQSERNVIYEIRSFNRYQNTFALDIVSTYFRLLQQKDTVRNEFVNYQNLKSATERAEALAKDRFSALQVDQARQAELAARTRYILAVQGYQNRLDGFKTTLGLPLGTELSLEDRELDELTKLGLMSVNVSEPDGYETAVTHRLDLLNEIDRFEDAKRKIIVAANGLKADLNLVSTATLSSPSGTTDYTKFNLNSFQGSVGLQLNLPIDRLRERNTYRTAQITFERQLRTLTQALDDVRNNVIQGRRTLDLSRQNFEIQKNAVEVATRQVESTTLLLQAGRTEIRNLLDAQTAQVQARNAMTTTIVDYHLARLGLVIDLGQLDTGASGFWLRPPALVTKSGSVLSNAVPTGKNEVIRPEELFGQ